MVTSEAGTAGAGFFWLAVLLWLALADFVTRPHFPPAKAASLHASAVSELYSLRGQPGRQVR